MRMRCAFGGEEDGATVDACTYDNKRQIANLIILYINACCG